MLFNINRTSDGSGYKKPCENAVKEKEYKYGNDWVVEIRNLEDLIALRDEVGEIILRNDGSIEIYDDYRE